MTVINHRSLHRDYVDLPAIVYIDRIVDKFLAKKQSVTIVSSKNTHEVLINNVDVLTIID